MKKNQIILKQEERKELEKFSTRGVQSVRLVRRAKIILALDTSEGRKASKQAEIARHHGISHQTVVNVRNDFLKAENVSMFLQRKKRATPPVPPKITGELEARVIALACSKPPQGYAKWTLKLLASKCVELQYVDSLSHTTVGLLLKKRN